MDRFWVERKVALVGLPKLQKLIREDTEIAITDITTGESALDLNAQVHELQELLISEEATRGLVGSLGVGNILFQWSVIRFGVFVIKQHLGWSGLRLIPLHQVTTDSGQQVSCVRVHLLCANDKSRSDSREGRLSEGEVILFILDDNFRLALTLGEA